MADNGREFTATTKQRGDVVGLPNGLDATDSLVLRGGTFMEEDVFRFADLIKHSQLAYVKNPGRRDIGFRVVIEAPRDQP